MSNQWLRAGDDRWNFLTASPRNARVTLPGFQAIDEQHFLDATGVRQRIQEGAFHRQIVLISVPVVH